MAASSSNQSTNCRDRVFELTSITMDATSLMSQIPPRNSDATVVWPYLENCLRRVLAHGLTAISPIEYHSMYQVVYNFCNERAYSIGRGKSNVT